MRRLLPARRPALALTLAAALVACGGEETDTPPDGPVSNSCGSTTGPEGSECSSMQDCGGSSNARTVSFCEHCFARPDTHVCESGFCRPINGTGTIKSSLSLPDSAAGALSFTLATVNPVMADGTRLSCASLMSTCEYKDRFEFSTGNSTFKNFGAPADPNSVYPLNTSADVGGDRILVVRVTTETQGKGEVVAEGCAEGIEVAAEGDTMVDITLAAVP